MTDRQATEADLLVSLGSQGTASLAVISKLMRALVTKKTLSEIEALAIFDAAAESVERLQMPTQIGERYRKAVAKHIRDVMVQFSGPANAETLSRLPTPQNIAVKETAPLGD
jgi:hypothetical protein